MTPFEPARFVVGVDDGAASWARASVLPTARASALVKARASVATRTHGRV